MTPAPFWEKGWKTWSRRLQQAPAVALFTDFDGTLAPIVSRHHCVRLPPTTRSLLARLSQLPAVFVAVISGRPVGELQRLVRLPKVGYIGIHGIETAWPGQPVLSRASKTDRERVDKARIRLEKALGGITGIFIERKPASVAVHYRQAPESAVPRVKRETTRVVRDFRGQLTMQRGKKVLEFLPAIGASKAAGVRAMLERLPRWLGSPPLPLYLGDDHTDETVFRLLRGRGLSIFVGRPGGDRDDTVTHSSACYYLEDPVAVRKFLRQILDLRRACSARETRLAGSRRR